MKRTGLLVRALACALIPALPEASARENGWLEYSAPPECPNVDHIERRVNEWLSGSLPAPERLKVQGTLHWTGHSWRTAISVVLDGIRTERSVDVETCLDGADLVALTTVLVVEPENAQAPEPEPPAVASPPNESDAPAAREEPVPQRAESSPKNEPKTAGEGPARLVGFGAFVRSGSLPGLRPGVAAQGGLAWEHLRALIEVRAIPPTSSLPASAAAPIDFSLYSLALSSCYAFRFQAFSLAPCLALEGGAMISNQAGDGPNRGAVVTPWLGFVPALEAGFRPWSRFGIYAAAGVSLPLTQHRLELDDGTLAHQAEVGADVSLGLHYFF